MPRFEKSPKTKNTCLYLYPYASNHTCADKNKATLAVSTILGQPARRQTRQTRQAHPRLPSHAILQESTGPLIATVVAASATAAVKLASRPPSCLGPSPLGVGGLWPWGRRVVGAKGPGTTVEPRRSQGVWSSGPTTTVGAAGRPSPLPILYVRYNATEVPTRTQSLRHRHQMSEDTGWRERQRRRRGGKPVGPSLHLR